MKKCIVLSGLFLFMVFSGCRDHSEKPIPTDVVIDNTPDAGNPTIISVEETLYPPHIIEGQEEFEWEWLGYLPLPENNLPVPMPWTVNARRAFSDDIALDYFKNDGWELHYSTFSSQFRMGELIFSLYNKYRGLLRIYYFTGSGTEGLEDYIIFANVAMTNGPHASQTPMLNFSSQQFIDVGETTDLAATYELQQLSDSTWYAFEYELAFDKEIYQQDINSFVLNFSWDMRSGTNPLINGVKQTRASTKIRATSSDFAEGNSFTGNANVLLYGQNDLINAASAFSVSEYNIINDALSDKEPDMVTDAVLRSLGIGNLEWPAEIEMQFGQSGVGLANIAYPVSGADNSVMQGPGTFYNRALGVFYLNKIPEVIAIKSTDALHPYDYSMNPSTLEYIFNPAVLEIADIENFDYKIIGADTFEKEKETLYIGRNLKSNRPLEIKGIRIRFDVVPKNSEQPIQIIKSFQVKEIIE